MTDLGLIVDWCALWQEPRETPEKVEAFKAGLKGINQWRAPAPRPRRSRVPACRDGPRARRIGKALGGPSPRP